MIYSTNHLGRILSKNVNWNDNLFIELKLRRCLAYSDYEMSFSKSKRVHPILRTAIPRPEVYLKPSQELSLREY